MPELEPPEEQNISKEVTMVAYADDEHRNSKEQFVAAVTQEQGVLDKKLARETSWRFEITIPADHTVLDTKFSRSTSDSDTAKDIREWVDENGLSEFVEEEERTERRTDREVTFWQAGQNLLDDAREVLPEVLSTGWEESGSMHLKWKDDKSETQVRIKNPDFDERRILAKESEREADDLYETMAEHQSAEFEIVINARSQEELDNLTEEVVVPFHKFLSKRTGAGKVRYLSCTVNQTKKGECYNL